MSTPTVFITGAAAGIGRSTALKFARSGYLVGAYDIDETGLASLGKEITSAGGRVVTGTLDVTCLLYTSPSPRDGLLSRMPSSA